MSECVIVPFESKYLDDVLVVESECFRSEDRYNRFIFNWFIARNPLFYLLRCGNETVGYILAIIERGVCHIDSIAVKPKWRGRGLGEALLKKTLDECRVRGARRAILEVAVDNEPAIKLYLKTGFRVKGVIKGYYVDRDAYLMELALHDQLDSRTP